MNSLESDVGTLLTEAPLMIVREAILITARAMNGGADLFY